MYEINGKKIQGIAMFLVFLAILGWVVIGIVIMSDDFVLGLAITAAGCLSSYASGVFLSAFSELVQSNSQLLKTNELILQELKDLKKQNPSTNNHQTPSQSKPAAPKMVVLDTAAPNAAPITAAVDQPTDYVKVASTSAGMILCPKCGVSQRANRSRCFRCGTGFDYE